MALVEKLNFKFDVVELRNYVDILKKEYMDHSWGISQIKDLPQTEYMQERVKFATQCYGWAVTTENLNPESKSNSPWPEAVDDTAYQEKSLRPERKTPMCFGVIDRLFEKIPYVCKISLSIFPPGGETIPHKDQDFLLRVHVPIYTNKKVRWLTDDGYHDMHEEGSAYLCDTREMHSVYNDSKYDRVHLIFAVDQKNVDHLRTIKGVI